MDFAIRIVSPSTFLLMAFAKPKVCSLMTRALQSHTAVLTLTMRDGLTIPPNVLARADRVFR